METRKLLLPFLLIAAATATTSGCAIFVSLPETPGLGNLSEGQVFSMAPPPEWPAPQPDNPQTASVDVSCGIGPRLSTGQLYAAVSVKGRPAATALPPLNVALVLDRSGSMHGEPFRNMLIAAQTFVSQLRDGDRRIGRRLLGRRLPGRPARHHRRQHAPAGDRQHRRARRRRRHLLQRRFLAGLAQVFGAFNPWQLNQVVLFSDGQPNIGITSTSELARIAARAAEHGVAITTIGFGMEHDELLMQGMADASGGNYYYVDSPATCRSIFQQEAGAILRTAARVDRHRHGAAARASSWTTSSVTTTSTPAATPTSASAACRTIRSASSSSASSSGGGGQLPIGLVYSDLARRGRFGVSCAPGYDGAHGRPRQLGAGAGGPRGGGVGPAGIDGVGRQRQRGVRHLADRLHARHHRDACASAWARRRWPRRTRCCSTPR